MRDSEEGVEIVDVKNCQKCGKDRMHNWQEEEDFVDEIGIRWR